MICEILELLLILPALYVFARSEYSFWHSFWVGYATLQLLGIWHMNTLLTLIKLVIIVELYFKLLNHLIYQGAVYAKDRLEKLEKKYALMDSLKGAVAKFKEA